MPAKRKTTKQPVEQPAQQDEPTQESPVSEEVRAFAQSVRHQEVLAHKSFEPARGVELFYGYNGLSRVLSGHRHVHIATEDELAEMSDQALYDAVMAAGRAR